MLTGGGALLHGMDTVLADATGLFMMLIIIFALPRAFLAVGVVVVSGLAVCGLLL